MVEKLQGVQHLVYFAYEIYKSHDFNYDLRVDLWFMIKIYD